MFLPTPMLFISDRKGQYFCTQEYWLHFKLNYIPLANSRVKIISSFLNYFYLCKVSAYLRKLTSLRQQQEDHLEKVENIKRQTIYSSWFPDLPFFSWKDTISNSLRLVSNHVCHVTDANRTAWLMFLIMQRKFKSAQTCLTS